MPVPPTINSWSLELTGGGTTYAPIQTAKTDIPDNGTATSNLVVNGAQGYIYDVNVRLTMTHPSGSDLRAYLISPAGTRVELFSNVGSGANFANTQFDDYAPQSINAGSAPFSGWYAPAGSLASFNGEVPNGTWQLEVSDGVTGKVGALNNWTLSLTTVTGSGEIHGFVWDDQNGSMRRDTNLVVGTRPDAIFAVDVSYYGWYSSGGSSVGDVNQDGRSDTVLDGELAGFVALNQQIIDSGRGNDAVVGIVIFGDDAQSLDMDPVTPGVQLSTTPLADRNNNGIRDVDEVLHAIIFGYKGVDPSDANYEAALQQVITTLQAIGSVTGNGSMVFLAAGDNYSYPFDDEVATLRSMGVNQHAFGAGEYAYLPDLQMIDPNATIFATTDELVAAFNGTGGGVGFLEPGLSGWRVYLDQNNNGALDAGEPTATTDATGGYAFCGLPGGTYAVRQIVQTDWSQAAPAGGAITVALTNGAIRQGVNFGNRQSRGDMSGFVWNDQNGNGVRDTDLGSYTEPGLANCTVYLDSNGNGAYDLAVDPATTTDGSGNYVFAYQLPGDYVIREVSQGSLVVGTPASGAIALHLSASQIATGLNFGNVAPGSISGVVFDDRDGDGARDAGEPPLLGTFIYIDANRDGQYTAGEQSTTSGPTGAYRFDNVGSGLQQVRHTPNAGYMSGLSVGPMVAVTLAPSEHRAGVNFADQVVPPPPSPDIDVVGIANNSTRCVAKNGTEFGSVRVAKGAVTRTFTIRNVGTSLLWLNGSPIVSLAGKQSKDFKISTKPYKFLLPQGKVTFSITFDPSVAGSRTATVVIPSTDPDENPYRFAIHGTGMAGRASRAKAMLTPAPRAKAIAPAAPASRAFNSSRKIAEVLGSGEGWTE